MKLFIVTLLLSVVATAVKAKEIPKQPAKGCLNILGDINAEREQIKKMSEEERLFSYFTADSEQACPIYDTSVIYEEGDFKNRFGNMEELSDLERESVYGSILNEIQDSKISTCHNVTKRTGVLFNSTHKVVCEDIEEVTPMKEYKGVSCHCFFKASLNEILYVKRYPLPSSKCFLEESSWNKCFYLPPFKLNDREPLEIPPPVFFRLRSLWTKGVVDYLED